MNFPMSRRVFSRRFYVALSVFLTFGLQFEPAFAQSTAYRQAVAEAAAFDDTIAAWYRTSGYDTLWTSADDAERRTALLTVLDSAADHGLPVARYDAGALRIAYRAARTEGDRGRLEVMMTRAFLDYAHDIHSGVLVPSKIDAGIVREVPMLDPRGCLVAITTGNPLAYLRNLPPKAPAYAKLMKEKITLQARIANGGWGEKVQAASLKPGATGAAVVQLRNRLIALGYLARTATQTYDAPLEAAIQEFQVNTGLEATGIASENTIAQLNTAPEERLKSVIVAMERERWLNIDRGDRYVWVNLTDFSAKIIDHGKVTFATRSVIGKNVSDRRTPEFSDQIEFMVVNPSWNVPRSITTKEYLPLLQRNPNAAGQLNIIDRNGRVVPRGAVNFAAYTAKTFPFSMRQAPSEGNALGVVKFMFPNPYNIYLHDTPSKSLFAQEVRDFSHGCIRLGDPVDFAHALLAVQTADPTAEFARFLNTGRESPVKLDKPVPVHLVYFTADPSSKGKMNYRRDVYGRDALIYDALMEAGLALRGVQG
jgi:L,D-transpeptidase YcbB